jgi:putative oxidoreductase
MRSRELRVALLVLRIGLGVFLLLWSIDKMVAPEQTAKIFQIFYKTPLPASFAPAVGALEAALSLALLAGLWKTWTYGAALALHAISTLSTWKQLLTPFGEHHLFIAAIPVLAGFVTLFLLRREDTLLTLRGRGGTRLSSGA